MGNFFGTIYCWFEDLFGVNLGDYMWGVSSSYSTDNSFIPVGIWMFVISLLMVLIYYYVVNRPALCNWWGWLIFLGINAGINFILGWQLVLSDYYEGKMVRLDPASNLEVPLDIDYSNILCFGVANMILSIFAFIIFSYCFKWWSRNCSSAPF